MKSLKKILIICSFMFLVTGCFKTEELDNARIYTTIYPIEYLINEIYGYNSEIYSIYPNGVNPNEYDLSTKKINKYSKSDLFVYNGLTNEKKIAASFVNRNKNLKIIDVSEGLAIKSSEQELWLNPSNYLMLAQNIKKGLNQYIESNIIKEEVEKNYDKLKEEITKFETELKIMSQNSSNNVIIVSKNYFNFLNNFGFEVISLEDTEELNNDIINRAKKLLSEKSNSYVFISEEEENNTPEHITDILKSGGEKKVLNTFSILTSEQRELNENYLTLMQENLELLKEELYK